jgi:hypothetical protein
VLDESGQVIGMATLVYREGQNVNFAISSEKLVFLCEMSRMMSSFNSGGADSVSMSE